MEQQLAEWLKWNTQNNNLRAGFTKDKNIDTVMGVLGDKVLSLAEVVGDNKTQLKETDSEINDLFEKFGIKDEAFINKLQASPVTGMATILCACQNRAGFLPYKGEYSLTEFNQFVSNLVKCPFINIADNKSFNVSAAFTDKDKVMPDSVTQNYIFDNGAENNKKLLDKVQNSLTELGDNSCKLDIYNMEISGDTDAVYNIRAGTIDITCSADKSGYKFSALAKGFNIKLVMLGTNWDNYMPQIIKAFPFAPISQWIKMNDLP